MSDNTTCDNMLSRLMKAVSAGSDAELARALGIRAVLWAGPHVFAAASDG